ncbi:MAG TPA: choice-of-anchor T family protein [Candidatus Thalassarchaeaceae archaeon]|nr:choice-of-anchor T family protein [Candidatus Thalassarchaeaceae archaeon]
MSAARSVRPALMMLAVYFLSTWAGVAAVQAQTGPVPDVSLSCDQPQPIDVYPGATRSTIINCRVENPTIHQEKVRITIQAGVLAVSGPASLTIGSGSEVSFQVSVRAELRAPEGQHQVSISAEVTMANGIPVTSDPTSYNIMAIIRQFSRLRVASEVAFLQLRPKVDYMLVFDVYNDGNAMDRFNIEIQNYDDLNDEGFQLSIPLVSVEIESMAPAEKIRVQMRTPKNQGWTDKYFSLQFKATSEYSVRTEGIPNYQVQTMTIYIRGVYLPGFELIGTAMMTALAAAAFAGRTSRYSEDEDSELVELDSRIF